MNLFRAAHQHVTGVGSFDGVRVLRALRVAPCSAVGDRFPTKPPSSNSLTDFTKTQQTWQHRLYQPTPIMTTEPWWRIAFRIGSMIILFYYSLDVWSKKFCLIYFVIQLIFLYPPPPICSYKESRAASAIYPQCVCLSINAAVSISNICVGVCTRRRNNCACQTIPRFPAPSALHDMKHLWFLIHSAPCNLLNLCGNGSLSPDIVHLTSLFCSKLSSSCNTGPKIFCLGGSHVQVLKSRSSPWCLESPPAVSLGMFGHCECGQLDMWHGDRSACTADKSGEG